MNKGTCKHIYGHINSDSGQSLLYGELVMDDRSLRCKFYDSIKDILDLFNYCPLCGVKVEGFFK